MFLILSTFFFPIIVIGNTAPQFNQRSSTQSSNQTDEYYGHVRERRSPYQGDILLDATQSIHTFSTETPDETDEYGNVWEKSGAYQGDILLGKDEISDRNIRRTGWWPYGIVPFVISPYFSEAQTSMILAAMRVWENVLARFGINDGSCQIQFVPRGYNDVNYVEVTTAEPGICNSNVGVMGGRQQLHLGVRCFRLPIIVHELGHVLGLGHEQQRYDRDNYIEIIYQNVIEKDLSQFQTLSPEFYTTFGLPYDYRSIMHYSPYAFAKLDFYRRPVGPTIVSLDPSIQLTKNVELSPIDMEKVEIMYCRQPRNWGLNGYN